MKTTTGNLIFVLMQVFYTGWFLSFMLGSPPIWIHAIGLTATVLFLSYIIRGGGE